MQDKKWLKEQSEARCCGERLTIVWIPGKGYDRSYCKKCEKTHSLVYPRKYMISLKKVFSEKIDTRPKNH